MPLPLIVYALLFLLLLFVYAVFQARKARRPQPAWGSGAGAAAPQAVAELVSDCLRIFVLLAGAVSLSIVFSGKPGLLPQYGAWAVVVAQVVKCWAIYGERSAVAFALRVLVLVVLVYLWAVQLAVQLPWFNVPTL